MWVGVEGEMEAVGKRARLASIGGAGDVEKGGGTLRAMGAGTREELTREHLIIKLKA